VKLEEGKGHGTFSLAGEQLVGGKYDVMVWGDSNGQATAVQKLQVDSPELARVFEISGDALDYAATVPEAQRREIEEYAISHYRPETVI